MEVINFGWQHRVGWASRVSACGILATVLERASESACSKIKDLYTKLCEDEMPMVRRAAAANLGSLVKISSQEVTKTDLLPLFNRLVGDEQDNVRPLAVEAAIEIAKVLGPEDTQGLLIGPLHAASKDRSWRVRHVVAERFRELQTACGLDLARTELSTMLVRLMRDQEKEVCSLTWALYAPTRTPPCCVYCLCRVAH